MIKVFDRTIDLAQFNDDTPLYSVCRAWMKNKSRDQAVDSATSPTNSASEQVTRRNIINSENVLN